jgi:single-strand DNA-binding protein|nr:MAG TPA: Single strand binding protein [Caudoviricetes sp.]
MNKFIGLGRLTKDPELRSTHSGLKITSFTLAINRNFKNKEGNYDADFLNCQAFDKRAEFIEKYFKKGNMMAITARAQTRNYDDSDGKKRFVTEFIVEEVYFAGSNEKKNDTSVEVEVPQNYTSDYDTAGSEVTLSDEDLPFL